MVWRGNLTKFESSNISETREATPIKIGVHAFDNSYLHKFFEPILFDSIFSRSKGKFGQNWKLILSPKPERPHPPKLVYMHLTSAPICMKIFNRFYFWPPWTMIVHGPKGDFGHFEDKCKGEDLQNWRNHTYQTYAHSLQHDMMLLQRFNLYYNSDL